MVNNVTDVSPSVALVPAMFAKSSCVWNPLLYALKNEDLRNALIEVVKRYSSHNSGTPYGIHEQFPEEIEATRRNLYPILRLARRDNKKAVLVRDRLYVDGTEVKADDQAIPGLGSQRGRRSSSQRMASRITSDVETTYL
ncbi:hypothetical protein DPMN_018375 [Dreissena polymorpha]|uniref:Uncharacterized protein n=1 Tax=Dreissena polymorpha TaxID=45954 RepID=A0A9D4NIA1_DREPO|nr:hypothetical protein DPMN_018375 [Dreissena polymorpha]